jgi:undecaprenyl-diphosphatase
MAAALFLGIIQGLTEFLPVSSTAHLVIFPWFFGWHGGLDSLTFDIALHAGTLVALVACFWRDWVDMAMKNRRLFWLIVVASVPAGIAGVLLNDMVETNLRSPYIICGSLVIVGVVMLLSERSKKTREMRDLSLSDAVAVGLSQAVALIPGVSRSGITISAGLFRGMEREAAARFSFLLSTPVIAGAVVLHAHKIFSGRAAYVPGLFAAGFVASAVTGFVAIKFLMQFFRKHPLNIFVYYRFCLAAVIVFGLWARG